MVLFSNKYFMYFEDVELSLKLSEYGKLIMDCSIKAKHKHNKESHRNLRLFIHHLTSAIKFFVTNINKFQLISLRNKNYLNKVRDFKK